MLKYSEEIMAICSITAVFSLGTTVVYFVTFHKVDVYPVIQGLFILIWFCLFIIYLFMIGYYINYIIEVVKQSKEEKLK